MVASVVDRFTRMAGRSPGCVGASLAEVLVALTLLGLGASLSMRLLAQAEREIQGAEIGLRAAVLLAETGSGIVERSGGERGAAGPGTLTVQRGTDGLLVRYEPPPGGVPGPKGRLPGMGGYLEAREWRLHGGSGEP